MWLRATVVVAVGSIVSALMFSPVSATILNLIPPPATGTLATDSDGGGGTTYTTTGLQPTGTGVIKPFLRIEGNSSPKTEITQGYNTDFRPVQFNEKHDHRWTHSLPFSEMVPFNIGGTSYFLFLLDANQTGSNNPHVGNTPALSIDRLQIYLAGAPDLTDFEYAANGGTFDNGLVTPTLVYSLDTSTSDNRVDIPVQNTNGFDAHHGSGSGDLYVYIPVSAFGGATTGWVYLYSLFGTEDGTGFKQNGGFEEWAFDPPTTPSQVPSPSSLGLMGIGGFALLSVVLYRSSRGA